MTPEEKLARIRAILLDIIDNRRDELRLEEFKHQREAFQVGYELDMEHFSSMIFNTIFKDD